MNSTVLFDWRDLFRWDLETDSETMYEEDPDEMHKAVKVMGGFEESEEADYDVFSGKIE